VLAGIGPHALDMVLWWLGDYDRVEYYDDAIGGVEANCLVELHMRCGASGVVELSRNRALRNSWIIRGERGTLEVGTGFDAPIQLETKGQGIALAGQVVLGGVADSRMRGVFLRQLDDFADAIRSNREPFIPGREGRRSVELTEACYAVRKSLPQPWVYTENAVGRASEVVSP
jgi:predicted dehydrogenase